MTDIRSKWYDEDSVTEKSRKTVNALLGNNDIFIAARSTINITLNIYYDGSEQFAQNFVWGPKVVDHFILYYIFEGKGLLTVGDKTWPLKKGDGFLVPKDVLTSFRADANEPMQAAWVGFYGYLAERYLKRSNLSPEHPVFSNSEDVFFREAFTEMIEVSKRKYNRYCKMMSILYDIMWNLIDSSNSFDIGSGGADSVELYLRKSLEYIDMNYSKKMSVKDISDNVGLDRKYLHRIFKSNLEKSPQEYLIEYRMEKACTLIRETQLSVSNIASSVGYSDMFHFSKIFKKTVGVSPTEYRLHYGGVMLKYLVPQGSPGDDREKRKIGAVTDAEAAKDEIISELREVVGELKQMITDNE